MYPEAGKGGRHVRDRIVVLRENAAHYGLVVRHVGRLGRREGRHRAAENARGAEPRHQGAHPAEVHRPIRTGEIHLCFSPEETALIAQGARIDVKAVFQNETDLPTVAQSFASANSDAGLLTRTRLHLEVARGFFTVVLVSVTQRNVDQAVDLDVGSLRCAANRQCAENRCR